MENDTFDRFLESLIARKLEKDKNLRQESKRYWEIILNGSYDFDRSELIYYFDCLKGELFSNCSLFIFSPCGS